MSISESKSYDASLFRQHCAICHGPEAEGRLLDDGTQTPNLRLAGGNFQTDAQIRQHITEGGNGMVPFRDILTDGEIKMMVDFVQTDLRTAK
ncbi:MAG: cytochrome c [Pyrinomonadaceae bacterium]